jgi:hypothetical protein
MTISATLALLKAFPCLVESGAANAYASIVKMPDASTAKFQFQALHFEQITFQDVTKVTLQIQLSDTGYTLLYRSSSDPR